MTEGVQKETATGAETCPRCGRRLSPYWTERCQHCGHPLKATETAGVDAVNRRLPPQVVVPLIIGLVGGFVTGLVGHLDAGVLLTGWTLSGLAGAGAGRGIMGLTTVSLGTGAGSLGAAVAVIDLSLPGWGLLVVYYVAVAAAAVAAGAYILGRLAGFAADTWRHRRPRDDGDVGRRT